MKNFTHMKSTLLCTILLAIMGLSGIIQLQSMPSGPEDPIFNNSEEHGIRNSMNLSGTCLSCPNYDYNLAPSTIWETSASSIETFGCKMYRFYVSNGNTYTFKTGCGDGATATYNTVLELFNNSCTSVAYDDDGCEDLRSTITWTANYTGYVFLKVSGQGSAAGKFTLAFRYNGVCGTCLSCPNYDFNGTPTPGWQTHSSSIISGGCKMYRFYVNNGSTYTFKTGCGDGATANFDTFIELLNSNCSVLANNDDGCENFRSFLTWTANYSGYVYLKVKGYDSSAGNYTLSYRFTGYCSSCTSCPNYDFNYTPTPAWANHASSIEAGGCKIYRFFVTNGNSYNFKTGCGDGATANFDTYLELYNSSCSLLASNDDGCEYYRSSINWTANYSGYVYLKVRGFSNSAGYYTLAYRYNGTCGTCTTCPNFDFNLTPTTVFQTHASSIVSNACKMYRFYVTGGNTYTFKTGCGDGATATFNTLLELYGNNCSLVVVNDDACENNLSSITWAADYSGYVYLKVSGIGSSAGKFTIAYKNGGTCGTCPGCPNYDFSLTPTSNFQTHTSGITAFGCKMYRFDVVNGQTYTFKTGCGDGATANFDTFLELYNSSCATLAIDDDGCENLRSSITWTAGYSGYVYLKVRGYSSSAGTYNLSYRYTPVSGPCLDCPNYDYNVTPGNNWQTHCASILPNGCRIYRFAVTPGNTYIFKTGCGDGATANFDTFLELMSGSCSSLAVNDNGCDYLLSSITWISNYSGYVYLKVSGVGSSSGIYNLAYRISAATGTCLSCPSYDFNLAPGDTWQTHCSSILPNGCKMYRIPVVSGNTYTFKTGCGDGATANFNTFLELFNGNCSSLATDDDGCENLRSSITWIANYTGYAYIKVSGVGSSAGNYNLSFRYAPIYGPCISCPGYDFSFTPGSTWQTHCSNIQPNGCKMYRFAVITGNTYTFKTGCGDGATANFNTFLELFNESCYSTAINDDGCENQRSSITWIATYSGYVYLKISGVGSSADTYNLAFSYIPACGSCVSCPNYDFTATSGTYWQSHCSSILPYGCKMYRFPVISGYSYTFKTGCGDGATANFDTFLELYNGSCSTIALDDDGCENLRSSLTWVANYTGYVYLKVRGVGATAGTYNLAYKYVASCGSCVSCPNFDFEFTPVTSWCTHSSTIAANGCKMYRFWVTGGNTYTFKTGCGDGATANFDTYLELYNGNCNVLANNDDGCENLRSSINWLANFTGYVYLKVKGWGACGGNYTLAFRYGGTCGSCVSCPDYDFNYTASTSWQTHCSSIPANGCKMYRFWVSCGNAYTFKTGCGDGATANFDSFLELFNGNCTLMASNDDGCENLRSSITWTANYTGYVYLKVRGLGSSSGTYILAYRNNGYCGSMPVAEGSAENRANPENVCTVTSIFGGEGLPDHKVDNHISGTMYETDLSDVVVYPNPGNGRFKLAFDRTTRFSCELNIYNSFGQCVYKDEKFVPDPASFIDISNQANGLYYIYVRIGDELFRQKLIIQK